ncbi:MAG: esterase family protein [Muribaculaceae bacterium]|nr:esterase family protein [Muribaculaceae bacterium]
MRKTIITFIVAAAAIASGTSLRAYAPAQTQQHTCCASNGCKINFDTVYASSRYGTIGELSVPSRYIASPAKITVALPEGYNPADTAYRYPVVYLLNGHGGNNRSWSTVTAIDSLASKYSMIIVCPDGRNSWYWDSPIDPNMQMESYIIKELIPYVDSVFNTRADRSGRAITGFSMGGHGGLWLGFRHTDLFGSCGATSGGVDIRPFPKRWNMADRLGAKEENPTRWDEYTVMTIAPNVKNGEQNIIFDCGTEDFFFKVNNALDSTLTANGIEHVYLTSPGIHNGAYWKRSIGPQLEFFHKAFTR